MPYKKPRPTFFIPRNPQKYVGDVKNIVARSNYERVLMKYLDENANVLQWSSEETIINYRSPIDGRWHRYFPDFKVKQLLPDGTTETLIIEVKPFSQTIPPVKKPGKSKKTFIEEIATFGINNAKWSAAQYYCQQNNMKFQIITEVQLGL